MLTSLVAGMVLGMGNTQAKGMDIDYMDGDFACQGYVVKPMNDRVNPIVLVVHQWGGLTEYEKMRADMLASLGYAAFAVDIYGKGNRPTGGDRGQFAGKYKNDRALYRSRLLAALKAARAVPGVDGSKVAVIGYCFGGTGALELARTGADIKGAVSFHGSLDGGKTSEANGIKAKVLVCHGADDPSVPPAQVAGFMDEMRAGKVDWHMVTYGGAVHAFTQPSAGNDPSRGSAYDADADRRSWAELQNFLKEVFAG